MTQTECFGRLASSIARLQSALTPRERLALQAGLRAAHAEEALLAGDVGRAVAHFEQASKIARALFPRGANTNASANANANASATGFSFSGKAWRYFTVYRTFGLAPPKLLARRGPVLLTDNEAAQEVFGWREAERVHGGIVTVNVWKYTPELGWKQGW